VQALRDVVVAVMIEKRETLEHLDEILAVPGIDMVQFGPSDFAMSAGVAQPRAEIKRPEQARFYPDLGVRHFSMGTDLGILANWLRTEGGALRAELDRLPEPRS